MRIFVNLKSVGRRRRGVEPVPYELPETIVSLEDLITCLVGREVESFNARQPGAMLLPFLSQEMIEAGEEVGKVGFGTLRSDKKADPQKALSVALQGFADGLFRFLINEREIKDLAEPLGLKPDDVLTFLRLTFLAGRLW
ncbi:MAG: hypothetical protein LBO05_12110 [Deltaproteobacteria bacterium]|jgi:hypothetical protein|nr:hypothetical protein [Deltaproteobacteria bacterium]